MPCALDQPGNDQDNRKSECARQITRAAAGRVRRHRKPCVVSKDNAAAFLPNPAWHGRSRCAMHTCNATLAFPCMCSVPRGQRGERRRWLHKGLAACIFPHDCCSTICTRTGWWRFRIDQNRTKFDIGPNNNKPRYDPPLLSKRWGALTRVQHASLANQSIVFWSNVLLFSLG